MSQLLGESAMISETVRRNVVEGYSDYQSTKRFHLEAVNTNILARDALRRRVHWLARPMSDWVHVRRTTFVPKDKAANTLEKVFTADRFVPKLYFIAESIQEGINSAGQELHITQLADFAINRIGINYMHGKRNRSSEIPAHTDPSSLSGAVVVLRLSEGPSTSIVDNNTQIIFCKDVCDMLQIDQYEHQVSSNLLRVSATFANLKS